METSLVLRAANCWNAWGEAMSRLKALGLSEETSKKFLEDAYWALTRIPAIDYSRITAEISQTGLNGGKVRLHADDWHNGESLVMMIWKPPEGFCHLLSEVGMRERPGYILS